MAHSPKQNTDTRLVGNVLVDVPLFGHGHTQRNGHEEDGFRHSYTLFCENFPTKHKFRRLPGHARLFGVVYMCKHMAMKQGLTLYLTLTHTCLYL